AGARAAQARRGPMVVVAERRGRRVRARGRAGGVAGGNQHGVPAPQPARAVAVPPVFGRRHQGLLRAHCHADQGQHRRVQPVQDDGGDADRARRGPQPAAVPPEQDADRQVPEAALWPCREGLLDGDHLQQPDQARGVQQLGGRVPGGRHPHARHGRARAEEAPRPGARAQLPAVRRRDHRDDQRAQPPAAHGGRRRRRRRARAHAAAAAAHGGAPKRRLGGAEQARGAPGRAGQVRQAREARARAACKQAASGPVVGPRRPGRQACCAPEAPAVAHGGRPSRVAGNAVDAAPGRRRRIGNQIPDCAGSPSPGAVAALQGVAGIRADDGREWRLRHELFEAV
ncbi:hypothetical protein H4S02_003486, partial [Coemansia sp. RSA 2611]